MTPAERRQLDRIERKTNYALVGVALAILLGVANVVFGAGDLAAAQADQAKLPREAVPFTYYVSTSGYPVDLQDDARVALFYAVAMSSRQQIAERCVPQRVTETLYRLDLIQLQWDVTEWFHVIKDYPYDTGRTANPVAAGSFLPLVVDAGWLVVRLADTTESDAHYRLLYGDAKITRDQFLAFWGVNRKARSSFGIITRSENPIGPSVAGIRQIDNYPTNERGSAWGTRDSAKIDDESDPLQHLDGKFKHDAEEWLVAHPKVSVRGERGFLLAALLSNGVGERQEEAPPSIVTDKLGFRGQHAIRNWGSCVGCHAAGINPPSNNRVKDVIVSGIEIYAKKGVQEAIEQFHLSDSGVQITRDNEDFQAGVLMVTGIDGEKFASAFRAAVAHYDKPVDLAQASREVGEPVASLKVTLALANFQGYDLGARGASLVANDPVPRSAWEGGVYQRVAGAVEAYGR